MQQRGLAGPRRPRDDRDGPGREGGVEPLDRRDVAEPARHPARDDRLCSCNTKSLGTAWFGGRTLCYWNTKFLEARSLARRGDDQLVGAQVRGRVPADARRAKQVLGQAKPAAPSDDDRAVGAPRDALVADPAVADVDDAVGAVRRRGVVADHERRASLLAGQLGDQVEHLARRCRIELPRRLVGDQQVWAARERSAERDALLLAAGELTRMRVAAAGQAHPGEQLVRARVAPGAWLPREAELHADELARRQLARERTPVMLVGVADRARAVAGSLPPSEHRNVRSGDGDGARGRTVEARHDPQQGRLARAARTEDDAELTLLNGHRQTLKRGNAALGRAVDAKEIPDLDECGHSIASTRPGTGSVNARRVTQSTSTAATTT